MICRVARSPAPAQRLIGLSIEMPQTGHFIKGQELLPIACDPVITRAGVEADRLACRKHILGQPGSKVGTIRRVQITEDGEKSAAALRRIVEFRQSAL